MYMNTWLSGGNSNDVITNCTNTQLHIVQLPGNVVPVYACTCYYISCQCDSVNMRAGVYLFSLKTLAFYRE